MDARRWGFFPARTLPVAMTAAPDTAATITSSDSPSPGRSECGLREVVEVGEREGGRLMLTMSILARRREGALSCGSAPGWILGTEGLRWRFPPLAIGTVALSISRVPPGGPPRGANLKSLGIVAGSKMGDCMDSWREFLLLPLYIGDCLSVDSSIPPQVDIPVLSDIRRRARGGAYELGLE